MKCSAIALILLLVGVLSAPAHLSGKAKTPQYQSVALLIDTVVVVAERPEPIARKFWFDKLVDLVNGLILVFVAFSLEYPKATKKYYTRRGI